VKKIKGRNVYIVCPGSTLFEYKDKILKCIKEDKAVVIGCANISHILASDFHFWLELKTLRKFGNKVSKKTTLAFSYRFSKKNIRKYWKGNYITIKYTPRKWKLSYRDPKSPKYGLAEPKYIDGVLTGVLKTTGCIALFWAHVRGPKRIRVVGMDGYTFHSKEDLDNKKERLHCYGKGGFKETYKWKNNYKGLKKHDKEVNRILHSFKKNKIEFEIITPTVFKDFYNPNILDIER